MRSAHISVRRIGNSHGLVIPKPILAQIGLTVKTGAQITIEGDALILRKPPNPARAGWAEAARKIAEADDDHLVIGEFANEEDVENTW